MEWTLYLILWLGCSVVCYFVVKSKGYPNEVCLKNGVLGFFLGFVWVIVTLCKKEHVTYTPQTHPTAIQQPVSFVEANANNQLANSMSALEQIGKLSELKNQGAITEAEFEKKKEELLRRV